MRQARDTADVVVVGGGIVGAFVARALANGGRQVEWLDPLHPEGTATLASGAMLSVLGEVTPDDDPTNLSLRRAAAKCWDALWDIFDGVPRGAGTVVVGSRRYASDQPSITAILDAAGPGEVQIVDPGDVADLRPTPQHAPDFAVSIPGDRWIAAPQALELLRRLTPVRQESVASLLHNGSQVHGVRTAGGRPLHADEVVICTGASMQLLDGSGLSRELLPPLIAAKGTSIVLEHPVSDGPTQVLRTPNRAFACGLHVIPRGVGVTYVGATNRAGRFPHLLGQASASEVAKLITDASRELMSRLSSWHVAKAVWGLRPLPIDGRPICGRTRLPGLSVVTGTYRNGLLLAPYLADQLLLELDGGPMEPALTPTRHSVTQPPLEVFRLGAGDLAELFRQPEWTDRISDVLRALAALALAPNETADARQALVDVLGRYGRTEMLPEALIELLQHRDHGDSA